MAGRLPTPSVAPYCRLHAVFAPLLAQPCGPPRQWRHVAADRIGTLLAAGCSIPPAQLIPSARIAAVPDGAPSRFHSSFRSGRRVSPWCFLRARYTVRVAAEGFREASPSSSIFPGDEAGTREEFILRIAGSSRDDNGHRVGRSIEVAAIGSGTKTLTPLRDVPQSVTVVHPGADTRTR